MKKFTLILAAMLAVAFAAPAFAADNLELSGSFRVRGWDIKDSGFEDGDDASYFDQRMRVQAKIKASDNAYVVIRADMGDTTWGDGFTGGSIARPRSDEKTIDFDRLYGVYSNDNFELTIGQQYFGVGIVEVLDSNTTGIKLRLPFGMVEPTLFFGKTSENGDLDDDGIYDDEDLYAINFSFDVAGFDSNLFGGYAADIVLRDDDDVLEAEDGETWAVGLHTAGTIGMVNLVSELTYLGGEITDVDSDEKIDLEGLQFYIKADTNVNDAFNIGAEFLWAAAQDDDDEEQITYLSNSDFGDFTIADTNAPSATDVVVTEGDSPFDFTGDGAGVLGGSLFGSYKVMDNLTLGAKIAYLTPEDDDEDLTDWDSLTSYSIWAGYDLGSNTSLVVLYNIADPKFNDDRDEEDMNTLYARFMINF